MNIEAMINFLSNSPNQFFAASNAEQLLADNGYVKLDERKYFSLEIGGKYYVKRNNSAIIAFSVGKDILKDGFRIVASHTDSPSIVIKPCSEIISEKNYLKLNTECYGGLILSSWFDRALSLAGKVIYKEDTIKEKTIDFKKPLLTIPNLAIHLDREINNGHKIDKQKELLPILSLITDSFEKRNYILKLISDTFDIPSESILDFELSLYDTQKPCLLGVNNEFISSYSLDDLSMVYTSLNAFKDADFSSIKVLVLVDNEEIGSCTPQGADSSFLPSILERITLSFYDKREDYFSALAKSIMVSADLAHGVHPNFAEKSDITARPCLGEGIVLKYSAPKKYGTDGISASIFTDICRNRSIAYQKSANNSNISGGSTIGAMTSAALGIPVIDMGAPILAMHSIRELGAVTDFISSYNFFKEFYSYLM